MEPQAELSVTLSEQPIAEGLGEVPSLSLDEFEGGLFRVGTATVPYVDPVLRRLVRRMDAELPTIEWQTCITAFLSGAPFRLPEFVDELEVDLSPNAPPDVGVDPCSLCGNPDCREHILSAESIAKLKKCGIKIAKHQKILLKIARTLLQYEALPLLPELPALRAVLDRLEVDLTPEDFDILFAEDIKTDEQIGDLVRQRPAACLEPLAYARTARCLLLQPACIG
jgi:hypothetical protein